MRSPPESAPSGAALPPTAFAAPVSPRRTSAFQKGILSALTSQTPPTGRAVGWHASLDREFDFPHAFAGIHQERAKRAGGRVVPASALSSAIVAGQANPHRIWHPLGLRG